MAGHDLDIALQLFTSWLNDAAQSSFHVEERDGTSALLADGDHRVEVETHALIEAEDSRWLAIRDDLQTRLGAALPECYALWVPPGAGLPAEEPAQSVFADCVRKAALKLGPRERSYVPFPIKLYLRKTSAEGNVVSVAGGLSQHWARFTEHVRGAYDLDSAQLRRLPESSQHVEALLDNIIRRAEEIGVGEWIEIETIDAWTVQRVQGHGAFTIIGAPPVMTTDIGLTVRRNFRRILANAGPSLRHRDAGFRALVLLGPYARMEDEGATTALRGYDPTLYSGIEFVCLVADGVVKPLVNRAAAGPPSDHA